MGPASALSPAHSPHPVHTSTLVAMVPTPHTERRFPSPGGWQVLAVIYVTSIWDCHRRAIWLRVPVLTVRGPRHRLVLQPSEGWERTAS